MKNVESINQLKEALASKEPEIHVVDIPLAKKISQLKAIPKAILGSVFAAALVTAVNPIVGIVSLVANVVWWGRAPFELIVGLGRENSRELYFSYEAKNVDGQAILIRKP